MNRKPLSELAMPTRDEKLGEAIRGQARALDKIWRAMRNVDDPDTHYVREAQELVMVLARLVEGKTIHDAFGAPGDWGYQTHIGDALYRYYRGGQ